MVPRSLLTRWISQSPSTLKGFNVLQISTADVDIAYSILNNSVGLSSLQLLEAT